MINTNKFISLLLEYDMHTPTEEEIAFLEELLCSPKKSILEVFEALYPIEEGTLQNYMDYISLVKVQPGDGIEQILKAVVSAPNIFANNSFL